MPLHEIASGVRAKLVAEGLRTGAFGADLAGQSLRASFALCDALAAQGQDSTVYAGYFALDAPNPAGCFCGVPEGPHPRLCYLEPHAWTETRLYVVDLTVRQFAARIAGKHPEEVEIASLNHRVRWLQTLPRGVSDPRPWRVGPRKTPSTEGLTA